jgi:cytochrome c553
MMLRTLSLVATLAVATSVAFAQAPAAAPHHDMGPPKNIKVFPKDMTSDQIHEIMHKWTGDLGVGCSYCHAKDATTGKTDFPSDANPMKDRARLMLKMNMAINKDYLAQLDNPKAGQEVMCGTCHRGMAKPPAFVPPPHEGPAGAPAPHPGM